MCVRMCKLFVKNIIGFQQIMTICNCPNIDIFAWPLHREIIVCVSEPSKHHKTGPRTYDHKSRLNEKHARTRATRRSEERRRALTKQWKNGEIDFVTVTDAAAAAVVEFVTNACSPADVPVSEIETSRLNERASMKHEEI